jgi:hypothetical protein
MPVIALEQHIAEKVHAYTATYGPQEQESTRIKDLIDLLLIAELATPNADRLRTSLTATFLNRQRQPLPSALPPPPASWVAPTPAPQQTSAYQLTSAPRTRKPRASSTRSSPTRRMATGPQCNAAGPPLRLLTRTAA